MQIEQKNQQNQCGHEIKRKRSSCRKKGWIYTVNCDSQISSLLSLSSLQWNSNVLQKRTNYYFLLRRSSTNRKETNTSEHDIQKDSKNDYKLVLYTILINYNQSRRRPPRTPRPGGGTGVKGSYHGVVKSRIRWRKGRIRLERATWRTYTQELRGDSDN